MEGAGGNTIIIVSQNLIIIHKLYFLEDLFRDVLHEHTLYSRGGGGALGYFLGGYLPPGTPNWHPVLEKISPKIDTPF